MLCSVEEILHVQELHQDIFVRRSLTSNEYIKNKTNIIGGINMNLKELVSSTLGQSVTIVKEASYDIPADFYTLSVDRRLENRNGEVFAIPDVDILFTTEDYSKEVDWLSIDSFYKFTTKLYFYLSVCDYPKIELICNDISDDGFVTGFSEYEIMEIIRESKTTESSAVTTPNRTTECYIKVSKSTPDERKSGINLLLSRLRGVTIKDKISNSNGDIYVIDADADALLILRSLDESKFLCMKEN